MEKSIDQIQKVNYGKIDFDSWVDALNEYLNCLYDIGDTVTLSRDSRVNDEKFLWVS
ncbi:hypothetical protein CHCC14809_2240 [Bacillus licheniformis]|uniref:hypothetical protein n=1 Tax=Bacillus TaxID=1386 RepID=UPI000A4BE3F6|nr:hypothetical protein [Bacillus licheniformis]MBM6849429.1 hypothetical protein [Bacillus licheniformis]TWM72081.1 hypothetical protein CHCC14809_2240 [Bacillus licheniformis]UAL16479.1 hypothetical protein KY997_11485 [Bacillus paralicheniformis]UAL28261.1 hypothetical protein KY998_05160 [Bacillus paralicheniformis]